MPKVNLGSGTLWIGVQVPASEDRLRVDQQGRPVKGSAADLAVVSADATRNADGTITVKASVGESELDKLQQVAPDRLEVRTNTALPPGAQRSVVQNFGGLTSFPLRPVAFVRPKPGDKSKFDGVCLYSAQVDAGLGPGDLILVTATGFCATDRVGSHSSVGYVGDHDPA